MRQTDSSVSCGGPLPGRGKEAPIRLLLIQTGVAKDPRSLMTHTWISTLYECVTLVTYRCASQQKHPRLTECSQRLAGDYTSAMERRFETEFKARGLDRLDSWHIFAIAVDPPYQGHPGYSTVLLNEGFRRASHKPVHLSASTPKNRELYDHFGFDVCPSSLFSVSSILISFNSPLLAGRDTQSRRWRSGRKRRPSTRRGCSGNPGICNDKGRSRPHRQRRYKLTASFVVEYISLDRDCFVRYSTTASPIIKSLPVMISLVISRLFYANRTSSMCLNMPDVLPGNERSHVRTIIERGQQSPRRTLTRWGNCTWLGAR